MEDQQVNRRAQIALAAVALVLLFAAIYRWWLVDFFDAAYLPIGGIRRRVTVWASAAVLATVYAVAANAPAKRGFGLLLMTVPLWSAVWGFISSIPALTDSNSTLSPLSHRQLSDQYIYGLIYDLGYVGTGFLLWIGHIPDSFHKLAARMSAAGVPRRHEAKSLLAGYLIFPVILFGSAGLSYLFSRSRTLSNGNEASIWDNMTPYHDIMISITAAVTEELVYRVVGIAIFAALIRKLGAPKWASLTGAVVIQALIFAGAHGGYGTWSHVLLPLAFGLVAGAIYLLWGLWAIVAVHFLIDVYAFSSYTFELYPSFFSFLVLMLILNILASGAAAVWIVYRWVRPKQPIQISPK